MTRSTEELLAELEDLRAKVQESEELLNAIRSGNVDGLLIESADGPQVYTLKSAEQPYRVMVEQMHEGAATLDSAGLFLYANRRLATMLQTPLERLIGHTLFAFVDSAEHAELETLFRSTSGQIEVHVIDSGGVRIPVSLSLNPIRVETEEYLCLVLTDLSAVKQNEELRMAHAEAERVSRAKDEFMAMVSHELRTPMTAILGWASLVKMSADDPRLRENGLDAILQSAKVQARLIDDLLDMARLETRKLSLSFTTLDLNSQVRKAVENLRVTSRVKQLHIEEDLPDEAIPVRADGSRIYQIVWNLLSNAFKFSQERGRVAVHLSVKDGFAELRVEDDGVGIAPDYLPRVFDRFSQADATTTRTFGGLGLGLSIVRHLVAVHGGSVSAASEGPGKGSTFTVRLPLAAADGESPDASEEEIASLDDITVLIVEDDAETREFIAALVTQGGGVALTAATVPLGLAILERERPNVVVSDIALPGEDGLSFVRKLRMHDRSERKHTPAIAVSALGTPENRERALFAGFDLFLEKPLQAQVLSRAIADTMPHT